MNLAAMGDLTAIEPVSQDLIEGAAAEANTADPPPTASTDRADDRDGKRGRHTEPGCDGMFEVIAGENHDAGRPQPRAPAGDGERAMEAEFGREEQARSQAGVGHDERDSYA